MAEAEARPTTMKSLRCFFLKFTRQLISKVIHKPTKEPRKKSHSLPPGANPLDPPKERQASGKNKNLGNRRLVHPTKATLPIDRPILSNRATGSSVDPCVGLQEQRKKKTEKQHLAGQFTVETYMVGKLPKPKCRRVTKRNRGRKHLSPCFKNRQQSPSKT